MTSTIEDSMVVGEGEVGSRVETSVIVVVVEEEVDWAFVVEEGGRVVVEVTGMVEVVGVGDIEDTEDLDRVEDCVVLIGADDTTEGTEDRVTLVRLVGTTLVVDVFEKVGCTKVLVVFLPLLPSGEGL
jgi:hypothetical protein